MNEEKSTPYKDNHALSRALLAALALDGLAGAACAAGCALLSEALKGRPGHEPIEAALQADGWLSTLDTALDVGAWVGQGLRVISMALWCVWIYRAYSNLRAFGAQGLRHSPGWAVAWYFVPLAHLVKPYQVMVELWRNSLTTWSARTPPLLSAWWGLWLTSQIVAHFASRASWEATTAAQSSGAHLLLTVSFGLDLPMALLAAAVVYKVTALQRAHPAAQSAPPTNTPEAP